jgi:Trk-type K+ transport system membrane component
MFELFREVRRPAYWSVHTRLTVFGTIALLAAGTLGVLAFEWSNPGTIGPLDVPGKLLAAFFQGTMPRSGGFNTIDYGHLNPETLAITDALMFIGGGSASTAGGIKVTTFLLLAYVIWAEVRGEPDVVVGRWRISEATQRQALTIALLGVSLVFAGTLTVQAFTPHPLDRVLFEVISAFATVGLSTGITPTLPPPAQLILIVLMYPRTGTAAGGPDARARPGRRSRRRGSGHRRLSRRHRQVRP